MRFPKLTAEDLQACNDYMKEAGLEGSVDDVIKLLEQVEADSPFLYLAITNMVFNLVNNAPVALTTCQLTAKLSGICVQLATLLSLHYERLETEKCIATSVDGQ